MTPFALYLHFPWCVRKCPYCDFNSHPLAGAVPDAGVERCYIEAMAEDLRRQAPSARGRTIQTLFLGGGTPSLMAADSLKALLGAVRQHYPIASDCEMTLEANPGTAETGRFVDYRRLGINRLSIGAQSFDAGALQQLGRIHGPEEGRRAVARARNAGFSEINVDLMYGLPGQTLAMARSDLEQALALDPTHVSYYELTIEPNTAFYNHPPALPGESAVWDMHEQAQLLFQEAGFERYEISAYARPGHQCRHNLNYWRFADYLGVGAGAHGKLTQGTRVERTVQPRHPRRYTEAYALGGEGGDAALSRRLVPEEELGVEFMLNAARLVAGFELALFSAQTGKDPSVLGPGLAAARDKGLVTEQAGRILPTELGLRFNNELIGCFG